MLAFYPPAAVIPLDFTFSRQGAAACTEESTFLFCPTVLNVELLAEPRYVTKRNDNVTAGALMATPIGPYHVRRSAWIGAPPERVWQEFESFERMKAWFGTGHSLVRYEPRVGGTVETDATNHENSDEALLFVGRVLVFDPPRELTFQQDWVGHGWRTPPLITFQLTFVDGGTLVELFHHGFDASSDPPGADLNGFESGWDNHHLIGLRDIVEGIVGSR